jgi:hypothetical protein
MVRMTILAAVLLSAIGPVVSGQELVELRKQKLDAAREYFKFCSQRYQNSGLPNYEELCLWSTRWMKAAQEADPQGDAVLHIQAHVDRLRELQRKADTQVKNGEMSKNAVLVLIYHRLDAQIIFERAKAKKER